MPRGLDCDKRSTLVLFCVHLLRVLTDTVVRTKYCSQCALTLINGHS